MSDLLQVTAKGLYCPPGDFYIDPWAPVERAVITHAHGDHARFGSKTYLTADSGVSLLKIRIGEQASIQGLSWGEAIFENGVRVSLHPAGHILGSAQVRIEHRGKVSVVSGDYKVDSDRTCVAFEPIACHHFVTESTFALPIYRWSSEEVTIESLLSWWQRNQQDQRCSVVFAYALGKAQRILAALTGRELGPIIVHGAVARLNTAYEEQRIRLAATSPLNASLTSLASALVIAPPSAMNTPWLRRFGAYRTAFASGWMLVRGRRRRRGVDTGIVLSDHADWPGLLTAIKDTGASSVWATHGYTQSLVRYLIEQGLEADTVQTQFDSEADEASPEEADAEEANDT